MKYSLFFKINTNFMPCLNLKNNLKLINMDINSIKQEAKKEIDRIKRLKELEQIFRKYLGKKGEISLVLRSLKDLPEKERKENGLMANKIKKELNELITKKKNEILLTDTNNKTYNKEWIDVTAPGIKPPQGHLHPITLVMSQIEEIFSSMGFSITEGPEIENEYYNFDALNVPKNHPARDLWDTFWIKENKNTSQKPKKETENRLLLRTHTSPMQVRYMEKHNPPLRVIVPGRCFRYEATDASHDVQFHQIEGLMIDKNISLANLKDVIECFMKSFYGKNVVMRWQPSYFPFVEPGLELLMQCDICKGKGCSTCGNGWIEVIPCGMVHPNVLKAVGYDHRKWQGFAFGMGLDRLVMMKYKIDDIRLLYSGDLRFLKQF